MARTLITSALPYINGVKHLGNLVGSMLPADVHARWRRQRGDEVLFICATDEHGTPAELAALETGKSVEDYCREMHQVQKDLCAGFAMSWDWFGRSSSPQNRKLTQHFCTKLDENGLIEERTTSQVYSVDDGRFLPDRYIVGTCPNCGYDRARGDQCENCTKLLDPTDLIAPRSAVSGGTNIEVRETRHLYLLQGKLQDRISEWIDTRTDWPNITVSIARKWLDEGLRDRAITRDLSWGVPVGDANGPRPGFQGKVFYVWFDAPIEYIGATHEWADATGGNWRRWWREDEGANDVRYVQFMAKDNVPFHTVGFPITLFGSGEPWKVVDYIKGFNWLTFYGGKFSTSQKRGVFMDGALDVRPADDWRWWLIANAPESADSSFTWESFQTTVNKDLADILGNFVNRILRFTSSRFGEAIPDGGAPGALEADLTQRLDARLTEYAHQMDAMEFRRATAELRAIWDLGNEYLTRAQPWTHVKTDRDQAAVGVRTGINLIRLFAILSAPFIPAAAEKMRAALGLPESDLQALPADAASALAALAPGHLFTVPDVLFTKIADEDVDAFRARFGGEPEAA